MSSAPTLSPRNPNTIVMMDASMFEPRLDRDEMQLAWAEAEACSASSGPSHHDQPGYRLVWTWGRGAEAIELPVGGRDYAIVGRHSECDVRLDMDQQLSLRHLLARAIVLDDGAVGLRLLSLGAQQPFFLEDGEARRSIVAVGPLMIRLGRYVIGAAPFGSDGADDGSRCSQSMLLVESSPAVPRSVRRAPRSTHVTAMPPPSQVSLIAQAPPSAGAGRLTFRRGRRQAQVVLSDADLETGVLIGRAERCLDRGLAGLLHEGISRTHLLLIRERESVYAYDLCSLQGTWSGGERVRRCLLGEGGAMLELGRLDPVTMLWKPSAPGLDQLQ